MTHKLVKNAVDIFWAPKDFTTSPHFLANRISCCQLIYACKTHKNFNCIEKCTFDMCTPRLLWIPEHCMHIKIPRFTLAHCGALHSKQLILWVQNPHAHTPHRNSDAYSFLFYIVVCIPSPHMLTHNSKNKVI